VSVGPHQFTSIRNRFKFFGLANFIRGEPREAYCLVRHFVDMFNNVLAIRITRLYLLHVKPVYKTSVKSTCQEGRTGPSEIRRRTPEKRADRQKPKEPPT